MKRAIIAGAVAAVSAVVVPAGIGNADRALSSGCQAIIDIGDFDTSFSVFGDSFYSGEVVTLRASDSYQSFGWRLRIRDAGGTTAVEYLGSNEAPGTVIVQSYTFDAANANIDGFALVPGNGRTDVSSVTCEAPAAAPAPVDADGDGVLDGDDLCPDTTHDPAPLADIKPNRNWPEPTATFGCSPTQIIDSEGLGNGHRKFGISSGALAGWIARVSG
jgi:hypothetical protein